MPAADYLQWAVCASCLFPAEGGVHGYCPRQAAGISHVQCASSCSIAGGGTALCASSRSSPNKARATTATFCITLACANCTCSSLRHPMGSTGCSAASVSVSLAAPDSRSSFSALQEDASVSKWRLVVYSEPSSGRSPGAVPTPRPVLQSVLRWMPGMCLTSGHRALLQTAHMCQPPGAEAADGGGSAAC
jgi:hypothetical protein